MENLKTPLWDERLMFLADIIQHMWHTGEIMYELGWTVLVIIPKGTTYTRGVVLLETLWKVVDALIDTRLCEILQFHDVLLMFRSGRGKGLAKWR